MKREVNNNENKIFRFKGYGLPRYGTSIGNAGNMIGIVNIIVPKELNETERQLLNQLKQQEHFKQ